jgi:O-Antigen ligase
MKIIRSFNVFSVWLPLAINLTTASQLRFTASVPLGVGEVMIVVWMVCLRFRRSRVLTPSSKSLKKVVLLFWITSFVLFLAGSLMAMNASQISPGIQRDAAAFLFASFFSVTLLSSKNYLDKINQLVIFSCLFSILPFGLMILLPTLFPFIDPWYQSVRFQGWSTNPHQIEMLIGVVPFLSAHLLTRTSLVREKILCWVLAVSAIPVGIATKSDGLIVSWVVSSFLLIVLYADDLVVKVLKKSFKSSKITVIKILSRTILAASLVYVSVLLSGPKISEILNETYDGDGSQGEGRLALWQSGIRLIGESPLFGFGPGAHIQDVYEAASEFGVAEAHNSFIDWAVSSGILGLICYLSLLGWVALKTWGGGSKYLMAALTSLIVMTIFGFLLRHTVFWFYLLMILGLSSVEINNLKSSRA